MNGQPTSRREPAPRGASQTHSAIFEGMVRHRRFEPVEHALRYRMFMMYLDLDELATVFQGACRLLWSAGRWNLACLLRKDHFGDRKVPLKQAVLDLVEQQTGDRPAGPVRMLAHLRYFGYAMNPATFYYCFDAAGEGVQAVVTEIHNTPWGERHCYVLPRSQSVSSPNARHMRFDFDKAFHVSPFMPMHHRYDWRFSPPPEEVGGRLIVGMTNRDDGRRVFDASLVLQRHALTSARLNLMLLKYPFMTARVVAGIYTNALKLRLKGAPIHDHPKWRRSDESIGKPPAK
ncbi:DUF1365 domain-containing protein [Phycisphaeraceae bacterium D3-23]